MSGKIEISRELAEDLLNPCADFATHDRLRALLDAQGLCGSHTGDSCVHCGGSGLLAAPVVERQPVAYLVEAYDDIAVRRTTLSRVPFDDSNREMREWARPWLVRETPLYTSPPAPVAVVLNESAEFNRWWSTTEVLKKNKLQIAQEAWQARACLDKVKELNQ